MESEEWSGGLKAVNLILGLLALFALLGLGEARVVFVRLVGWWIFLGKSDCNIIGKSVL